MLGDADPRAATKSAGSVDRALPQAPGSSLGMT